MNEPDRPRLLSCGLCFEENGEEVHPHPECTVPGGVSAHSDLGLLAGFPDVDSV